VELLTDRLVLRPLSGEDAAELAVLHADAEVTTYIGLFGNLDPIQRVAAAQVDWHDHGFGLMAVTDRGSDRFLGRCGLQTVAGHREVELGWVLHRAAWGHGYAVEAAGACLRWALGELALSSVISLVHPDNVAAARVASKIGMRPEETTELSGIQVQAYRVRQPPASIYRESASPDDRDHDDPVGVARPPFR
jgi:RimJ/RimL family protein N-acetyltransferase